MNYNKGTESATLKTEISANFCYSSLKIFSSWIEYRSNNPVKQRTESNKWLTDLIIPKIPKNES